MNELSERNVGPPRTPSEVKEQYHRRSDLANIASKSFDEFYHNYSAQTDSFSPIVRLSGCWLTRKYGKKKYTLLKVIFDARREQKKDIFHFAFF